jgi:hypothetical protein
VAEATFLLKPSALSDELSYNQYSRRNYKPERNDNGQTADNSNNHIFQPINKTVEVIKEAVFYA